MTSPARRKAKAGAALLAALLALGALALTPDVTGDDLHVDLVVRPFRSHLLTPLFLSLTSAAAEAAGLAALGAGIIVLLARRLRWDAARLLAMAGAAWALALAVKDLFARPRPPASLWLARPDGSGSFPSGHDTTATIMILVVCMALSGTGRLRAAGTALAAAFALAVGASRVYLGDHYPTDILGSYLTVAAAALLASAAADLPRVRQAAARLLRTPKIAPTAGAGHGQRRPPATRRERGGEVSAGHAGTDSAGASAHQGRPRHRLPC